MYTQRTHVRPGIPFLAASRWKECKVQAAWHECQEAHAGQTLLPNFTGHGMRARSRVGRRELLEDELEARPEVQ